MKVLLRKILNLMIALLIVTLLTFLALQVIPGDPVTKMLGADATAAQAAQLRTRLGLDQPVLVRYGRWLLSFLKGDPGISYSYSMPVAEMLNGKLSVTVILTALSFAMTVLISIPLGILTARSENVRVNHFFLIMDQLFMALPPFFIGILSVYLFGIVLKLFAPGTYVPLSESVAGGLGYLLLPALAMALPRSAMTVKMLRSSIRSQMAEDYVRTARSRGLTDSQILRRHALRGAMVPVVTFLAQSAAEIMTGTIIIEQVFTIPGLGRLLLSSIGSRDFPVVQAIVVLMAVFIILVNFAADLINMAIDPRIRVS